MGITAATVFETSTATIIEAIENGAADWTMPWSSPAFEFPINPTTNKHYRGGNVLTLASAAINNGYQSGKWATYKQWASISAQVRKGERGTACIWWNITNGRRRQLPRHERAQPTQDLLLNA